MKKRHQTIDMHHQRCKRQMHLKLVQLARAHVHFLQPKQWAQERKGRKKNSAKKTAMSSLHLTRKAIWMSCHQLPAFTMFVVKTVILSIKLLWKHRVFSANTHSCTNKSHFAPKIVRFFSSLVLMKSVGNWEKMLRVYYCHKATIYDVALAFGWRHDHHITKMWRKTRKMASMYGT